MASERKPGVEDARRNLPALLERAHRGQTVVITKRGRPYAAIVGVDQVAARKRGMSVTQLRGTGKGMWGRSASAWVERLRKEW